MQPKRIRFNVNGVILVNKPLGYSSNQTLSVIKKLFNPKKAGHTGTLDPLASGLLPICMGEATKFSRYILESNKAYEATIKLGFVSSTGDLEGKLKSLNIKKYPSLSEIYKAIKYFLGPQEQLPPMFSALKFKGKPLYEYARNGEEIERKKRNINIISLDILDYKKNTLKIYVECSKGTYIRTLATDIGLFLKTGGYLSGLIRTSVGSINLLDASTIESIEKLSGEKRKALVLPIDMLIQGFGKIIFDSDEEKAIKEGKTLSNKDYRIGTYKLYNNDEVFLGLGDIDLNGYLKVRRLIATN